MSGKLIVIDGLDGSGKATQAELLYETLKARGQQVMKVSFPDYASDSSALVRMYLNREFGTEPGAVNPYAASSFYAVDRFASYTKKWKTFYQNGGTVIADRYTTSNAIHQCAKLPEAEWDQFLEWLFHYEYRLLGIPAPSCTVYLRVDPEISQKLLTERYQGDEKKKDIHEADVAYLRQAQKAAEYCATALSWRIVECTENGAMRSVADIGREILAILEEAH